MNSWTIIALVILGVVAFYDFNLIITYIVDSVEECLISIETIQYSQGYQDALDGKKENFWTARNGLISKDYINI